MIQAMRFSEGGLHFAITEMLDDGKVVVQINCNGTSGSISANEHNLREMRKWITIQIRKMQKHKQQPAKK
jgi:hypothetical protein